MFCAFVHSVILGIVSSLTRAKFLVCPEHCKWPDFTFMMRSFALSAPFCLAFGVEGLKCHLLQALEHKGALDSLCYSLWTGSCPMGDDTLPPKFPMHFQNAQVPEVQLDNCWKGHKPSCLADFDGRKNPASIKAENWYETRNNVWGTTPPTDRWLLTHAASEFTGTPNSACSDNGWARPTARWPLLLQKPSVPPTPYATRRCRGAFQGTCVVENSIRPGRLSHVASGISPQFFTDGSDDLGSSNVRWWLWLRPGAELHYNEPVVLVDNFSFVLSC